MSHGAGKPELASLARSAFSQNADEGTAGEAWEQGVLFAHIMCGATILP
jgi:hypothetical protein